MGLSYDGVGSVTVSFVPGSNPKRDSPSRNVPYEQYDSSYYENSYNYSDEEEEEEEEENDDETDVSFVGSNRNKEDHSLDYNYNIQQDTKNNIEGGLTADSATDNHNSDGTGEDTNSNGGDDGKNLKAPSIGGTDSTQGAKNTEEQDGASDDAGNGSHGNDKNEKQNTDKADEEPNENSSISVREHPKVNGDATLIVNSNPNVNISRVDPHIDDNQDSGATAGSSSDPCDDSVNETPESESDDDVKDESLKQEVTGDPFSESSEARGLNHVTHSSKNTLEESNIKELGSTKNDGQINVGNQDSVDTSESPLISSTLPSVKISTEENESSLNPNSTPSEGDSNKGNGANIENGGDDSGSEGLSGEKEEGKKENKEIKSVDSGEIESTTDIHTSKQVSSSVEGKTSISPTQPETGGTLRAEIESEPGTGVKSTYSPLMYIIKIIISLIIGIGICIGLANVIKRQVPEFENYSS
ncbi:hypothetical protein BdWA1_002192 [Babesia duncani]|uniref:Uncharacterized protein n=1 Tax=Babesia duncani TaxID=323732 RepID=A0AAD9UPC9_9APIC|nr:hypothetical protein BdWA1_003641 [Babesia duncani]KAK2196943.1 hypothetical protein BdWA1_002192 [Babesia duncani]